jgi:hypothetical protein
VALGWRGYSRRIRSSRQAGWAALCRQAGVRVK